MRLVRQDYDDEPDDDVTDDPNDPRHPDFDLSESAPHLPEVDGYWEKPWFLRRGLLLVVAIVLVFSLLLPYIARF